jgi:hypothetical protein
MRVIKLPVLVVLAAVPVLQEVRKETVQLAKVITEVTVTLQTGAVIVGMPQEVAEVPEL